MAAEVLALGGAQVDLFDAMPSVGRKFLLAGKGGLNLTHSEAFEPFVQRYAARSEPIKSMLNVFGPTQLREWTLGLGVNTFVGSSGRVFPVDLKAAPPAPSGRAVSHATPLVGLGRCGCSEVCGPTG